MTLTWKRKMTSRSLDMRPVVLMLVLILPGCHGVFSSRSIDRVPPLFWNVEVGVRNVGGLVEQGRPGWAVLSSLMFPVDIVVDILLAPVMLVLWPLGVYDEVEETPPGEDLEAARQ